METLLERHQAVALPFADKTLTDDERIIFAAIQDAIAIITTIWDMFSRTPRYKTCRAIANIRSTLLSLLSCFHTIAPEEREIMYRFARTKFISKTYAKDIALIFRKAPAVWSDAERIETKERFTRLMVVLAPPVSDLRK